ncbi:MAG TPA: outer membrane beta-barrel protein [Candidatus Kapabacteria bacterium]|nr:outer membrane beta-barrel protein [Candidatus Kapabacteria bacterium]
MAVKPVRITAVILLLVLGAARLAAQQGAALSNPLGDDRFKTRVLIGPVGGIDINSHSGGFRVLPGVDCPYFTDGSGWGYLFGLTAEIQTARTWSIIPRITYESRPGHFQQRLADAQVYVPDSVNPQVVTEGVSATSDITFKFINMEVMYSQQLIEVSPRFRISAAAGPCMGYVLSGKITQVQDLEEPLNAQFVNPDGLPTENNNRRLIYARDQKISGLAPFRFSLKGGLAVELGLFHNDWILYPGVYFDYGLNQVTRNENWNLNTLIFQLELRHAL